MEFVGKAKYLKITPRKLRCVIDLVRGKNVNKAFNVLTVTNKRGCSFVEEVLKNAVNSSQNIKKEETQEHIDVDHLYIKEIYADEGPTQKRWLPRAMGRATEILKRTSHLTVKLGYVEPKHKVEE